VRQWSIVVRRQEAEMQRGGVYCVAVVVMLMPSAAQAAAGMSDIMATQACWVRAPFALVKCQSEGGRYAARVVRAKPTASDEDSSWSLVPVGYDGIVPLDTVVDDVDRVAFVGQFLVVRQRSGKAVVVDLVSPEATPVEFDTLDAANEFLARQGLPKVGEAELRSFESVYREFGVQPSPWINALTLGGVVLACGAAALLCVRRSRNRTSRGI